MIEICVNGEPLQLAQDMSVSEFCADADTICA